MLPHPKKPPSQLGSFNCRCTLVLHPEFGDEESEEPVELFPCGIRKWHDAGELTAEFDELLGLDFEVDLDRVNAEDLCPAASG
jgi:hypothetical protein